MPHLEVPRSADAIDPQWLEQALAERHPGVRVAAVRVSARQQWTNAHAWLDIDYTIAVDAPRRLFCKLPPIDQRRDGVIATGMGLREAAFYRDLAPLVPLRVPRAHAVLTDPATGEFAILLEDLVSSGCRFSDGPTGIDPQAVARVLEDMARFHVGFEDPVHRARDAAWVPPAPESDGGYAVAMLRYGLEHHRARIGEPFAAIAELYVDESRRLLALWNDGPALPTVIHADTHVGNLFDDHGCIGFCDWGMLHVGQGLRDVAYMLTMALAPGDRRMHERDLLACYLGHRERLGAPAIGFDDAWLWYRAYAAYTVVACCQVVTFPADATPKRRVFAESLLARSQAAVADLAARDAVREMIGI